MSEILTGSRLHFGLFQAGAVSSGQRRFGGAGMMIDRPGLRLRLTPSSSWSADGPLGERALSFAHHCLQGLQRDRGVSLGPHHLSVVEAAPEHAGLGTGTQLGMAVAGLLAHAAGLSGLTVAELSALAGRGRRSGLGVHGFECGGFLVDGGRRDQDQLAPLIARMDVPAGWRILVLLSPGGRDWYGHREQAAFEQLDDEGFVDRLCRLVLLGLLPALAERDVEGFGEALYELNFLAGEAFARVQGGCYAGPYVASLVAGLRALGVKGVGQSSWGPSVFGVVEDVERAVFLREQLCRKSGLSEETIHIAAPLNRGAGIL